MSLCRYLKRPVEELSLRYDRRRKERKERRRKERTLSERTTVVVKEVTELRMSFRCPSSPETRRRHNTAEVLGDARRLS